MRKKIILLAVLALGLACKKNFLDERPNKALLVPATLADLRLLLNNTLVFNLRPGLTTIADGDYYTTDAGFNGYGQDMERNSYTWAKDIYAGQDNAAGDWNTPYRQIFYANVVLEGVGKLPTAEAVSAEGMAVRGTALFHRAFALFNLASQFTPPYAAKSAESLAGLPLRLHADVTEKAGRSNLEETYARILADLDAARPLLPAVSAYKIRPTITALQALQARVHLSMGDYAKAALLADSALSANGTLLNYNTLSVSAARPFPRILPNGNDEVSFYAAMASYTFSTSASPTYVDKVLYASYATNDLRRRAFFSEPMPGNYKFKGNYSGTLALFGGLANDELYLIRAECRARTGDRAGAMADLNALLVKRWVTGTFVPYTATDAADALTKILLERRKELVGRGMRWDDLRRLNQEDRFKVTLTRTVLSQVYTLAPGSLRYTYPIPETEILPGGLEQNER